MTEALRSEAFNQECTAGMSALKNGCVDMTVTSPPYDNIRTYNGYVFDYEKVLSELYRVTKPGGVVVWIVSDQTVNGSETGTSFMQALYAKKIGFNLHDTMIWEKESCAFPEATRYSPLFEYMFVFSKGKPQTFNPIQDRRNSYGGSKLHCTERQVNGDLRPRPATRKTTTVKEYGARFNVWHISTEKNNKTGHPAVFPYALARDHIISWSNEGDTVLDPFLGSGTTRLAAYDLHRHFIGFEIDAEYFKKQEARFNEYTAQMRLL